MTPPREAPADGPPADDELLELAAACDEAMVSGSGLPATVPRNQLSRLGGALECMRLLREMWPAARDTVARADDTGPTSATPPSQLGRYHIRRELGRGGFGVVFLAFDPELRREVALKVPRADVLLSPELHERFRREALAAGGLDHPNIVPVFEAGDAGATAYIAYAYCPGATLAEWLAGRTEPVPVAEAARLVATLADAVQHAHGRGVLHRDLKPANILLVSGGVVSGESSDRDSNYTSPTTIHPSPLTTHQPKITDFGLAKLVDVDAVATRSGAALGTPSYMAPEQTAGRAAAIGPATDVYGLGAILYEVLTRRPPFLGETPLDTLKQVQQDEPLPPGRLRPRLPRDLETICVKCLHKEPRRRYASAAELAADLRRFLNREPIAARAVGPIERVWRWSRRRPATAGMAGALALAVVVGLAGIGWQWRRAEHEATLARQGRDQAVQAERDALERLRQSYVAQAAVRRASPEAGRRQASLDLLAEAARIRRSPDLRDEVIACLTLTELRRAREWDGNPFPAGAVDFDPALERYVRRDDQGDLSVRRVADDTELVRLRPPVAGGQPLVLIFSPDGQWLAANYALGRGRFQFVVWDSRGGPPRLNVPAAWLAGGTIFDPGSRRVAVSLPEQVVGIYDLASGKEQKRFEGVPLLEYMAFDPAGRRLAISSALDRVVEIRDVDTGDVRARLTHPAAARALAWAPGGNLLAVGGNDHHVHLWNMTTHRPHSVLYSNGDDVMNVAFNAGGNLLLVSGGNGTSRLWDPRSRRLLVSAPGFGIRFGPDDRAIAFMDTSRVGVWEVTGGDACRFLHEVPAGDKRAEQLRTLSVDFSPDGRVLAAAGLYGVRLWDLATARQIDSVTGSATESVHFHPGGRGIITLDTGAIRLWPRSDRGASPPSPPQLLVQLGSTTARMALTGDSRWLAASDPSVGRAIVVHLDRPEQPTTSFDHVGVGEIALSPDGHWLATESTGENSGIRIWDLTTGQLATQLTGDRQGANVTFSPDGRWLAVGARNEFRLHETESWRPALTIPRESPNALSGALAFTSSGDMLAVAVTDQKVRLVNPSTGQSLAHLSSPDPQSIGALYFRPDGAALAVVTHAQAIQLWNLRSLRQELGALDLDWER